MMWVIQSGAYGYKYGYQYGYKYGYKYGYNYGYGRMKRFRVQIVEPF